MVAYLPGQSTFEMQITSGKFESELFSMTNASKYETNSQYKVPRTEFVEVKAGASSNPDYVQLDHKADELSVFIRANNEKGRFIVVDEASELATGKIYVDNTGDVSKIQFFAGDVTVGGTIEVDYEYEAEAQEAMITNRSSAMGEAILEYPVYGNGDDCTDSAIIGHVIMHVFKCRVTSQPGLDGSYKTASTFQFTLSAMDSKRSDDAAYSIAFIKDGE